MPFHSGKVSFCRLRVEGDAPSAPDDAALSILTEHRFRETEIGTPDEVEVGFVTGEHILDTAFGYEKNGFGDALLFAMRMDTHKVPAELKKAYRQQQEQAAAAGSPTGFVSKAEKRDAKDEADRQLRDDLAAGKFLCSKSVAPLWDLRERMLYCAASGNTVLEHLHRLMKNSFAVSLHYQSAGMLAGRTLVEAGRTRDYEDLKPSAFTKPPALATADHATVDGEDEAGHGGPRDLATPILPWIAQAVDLKDFLGNEMGVWLWHRIETADGRIDYDGRTVYVAIDKALDMDCAWDAGGKQTLRGHHLTRLVEAGDALRTGKWPRKVGLLLSDDEHGFELSLQLDKMIVGSATLPAVEDAQSPRELTEARLELVRALTGQLDTVLAAFVKDRTSGGWPSKRETIATWVRQRG